MPSFRAHSCALRPEKLPNKYHREIVLLKLTSCLREICKFYRAVSAFHLPDELCWFPRGTDSVVIILSTSRTRGRKINKKKTLFITQFKCKLLIEPIQNSRANRYWDPIIWNPSTRCIAVARALGARYHRVWYYRLIIIFDKRRRQNPAPVPFAIGSFSEA